MDDVHAQGVNRPKGPDARSAEMTSGSCTHKLIHPVLPQTWLKMTSLRGTTKIYWLVGNHEVGDWSNSSAPVERIPSGTVAHGHLS
jgi:hypothetical protein